MAGNGWYPQDAGGLEKYQYGLARTLTATGDRVDYFCTGEPTAWDERSNAFALANPRHGTLRRLFEMAGAYRRGYREPYDVADLHFAFYTLSLLPLIAKNTPRVMHFHGPWAYESEAEGAGPIATTLKAWIERFVFARMDRFVVLSDAFKTILSQTYHVAPEKIDVIPMGVQCDVFTPPSDKRAVRESLGWHTSEPIVFTARRMVQRVGINELIEATKLLKRRGKTIAVKIAGKGPLLPELRATVEREGLAKDIEFLGFVSEETLVRAYQAADVTILPTQRLEGFGTIIAESLACGTPVIGTPVGGIVETLAAIDPSLLASSATPDAIAELLVKFCEGRLKVGEATACRNYAVDHFSWPRIAERNRSVYRRAFAERRAL